MSETESLAFITCVQYFNLVGIFGASSWPTERRTMTTEDNSHQRPLFLDLCFIEISNPSGVAFILKLQDSPHFSRHNHLDGVNFSRDIPENVFMRVFDTDLNWTLAWIPHFSWSEVDLIKFW